MNKIKGYRVMLNMTQQEMATELNISAPTYSNKERGERSFTDKEKLKILSLCKKAEPNLTIDTLFFDL